MRFYSILFILLLISIFSFAQQDRDYYVTVNSDTVYGKVKVNKTDFSLTKFKKPGEDYQIISGEVIRFYDAISQESYARLEIVKGSSSFYIEEIAGGISLLISPQHYYLVDRQGRYAEAWRNKKLSPEQYGSSAMAIKNLLTECVSIGEKEITGIYSEAEIVLMRLYNLVKKYNQCVEPMPDRGTTKKKKSIVSLEIMALAGVGNIKPSVSDGFYFDRAELEGSTFSQYQGKVKLGYSPRRNKFIITLGYAHSSFESSGTTSKPSGNSGNRKYVYTTELSAKVSDLSLSLEYAIFLNSKFSLYPTLGHSIVKMDIEKLSATWEYLVDGAVVTDGQSRNLTNDDTQDDVAPSFFYGLGFQYKITGRLRSSLEFVQYTPAYILFNPMDDRPEIEITRNNVRLGLGFMLIKD